ncbi:large subunit GTPase 1 homolog isoform X2 [Rhineura floridana]|uniref:large subunit GTPase 1 homolog isoform X2 n=1 Tax=Rhineura floridana TaxID=261503 RepID=UPI002AC81565|nr:large subunit GTPase 1 homolog isoform X2 [Rhineura floridana]
MGKKKAAVLGRALIRERSQGRGGRQAGAGWLHTSELNDGYNWGRLNLQSVTEQNSLEEFLATAELAGTEFVAEKLNIKIVPAESRTGLLTTEESKKIQELHEQNKHFLCIPRRPHWDKQTSPEMLNQAERDRFLEWRRQLARLEEEEKLLLTPFERNLDFWRQLWRVLERSDVVVQIVDARNPLLFRCQDLERYAKEISREKENLILLNKADLLSEEQRSAWGAEAGQLLHLDDDACSSETEGQTSVTNVEAGADSLSQSPGSKEQEGSEDEQEEDSDVYEDCEEDSEEEEQAWLTCSEDEESRATAGSLGQNRTDSTEIQRPGPLQAQPIRNSSHLVQRDELLEIFKGVHSGKKVREGEVTIGLVGYPNVGKSSTINTILGKKKVSVSATPGHTKHFQTLYVEPALCLCDCPGLVMPSFVSTKAEMICSGILPIDQMRDHVPPVSLVCQRIPRPVLEATYGINIIRPREDESPDRPPTAEELLTAYGYMRGFMTDHGQPDQPRSARYILKDYVSGKLLYCHPPPGIDPTDFQLCHERSAPSKAAERNAERQPGRTPRAKQIENVVDSAFFHQESVRALTRGSQSVTGNRAGVSPWSLPASNSEDRSGKPWKKHGNRNKKEKIRRVTKHLEA